MSEKEVKKASVGAMERPWAAHNRAYLADEGCVLVATVLMIGDHTDTVRLVRMALEFTSYELFVSDSFLDGISLISQHDIQLLLIENSAINTVDDSLSMNHPTVLPLPKIVLSETSAEHDLKKKYLNQGVDFILCKPFTPFKLHEVLNSILNVH